MKITSINQSIGTCTVHQAFLRTTPDLDHLEQALAAFSRKHFATFFAFDVVTQDNGRVTVKRYYAQHGNTEVVDTSFPPSSIKPVVIISHTVMISMPNGIVEVDVMAPADALQNELVDLAYQQIMAWRDEAKERRYHNIFG